MKFDCFYYPQLNDSNKIIRVNENIKEFDFGDKVPTKTLYYNYGNDFAIYQGGEFYIVENAILKGTMTHDEIKYPLNLVFNKGTQLTINSPDELQLIRLLLKGENEAEKELGDLFYLTLVFNRKITTTQYQVMSDLANCSRDFIYMNQELEQRTRHLLNDLKVVEDLFYNLTKNDPNLKNSYLKYMNFNDKEDLLELGIHRYFLPHTEDYRDFVIKNLMYSKRPIYPKFKLDNLINSGNYRAN